MTEGINAIDDAALDRLLALAPTPAPPAALAARIAAEATRPGRRPTGSPTPARSGAAARRAAPRRRWWLGIASINLALAGAAAASIEVAHHGFARIAALPAALFHPHRATPPPKHHAITTVAHAHAPLVEAAPPRAALVAPAPVIAPLAVAPPIAESPPRRFALEQRPETIHPRLARIERRETVLSPHRPYLMREQREEARALRPGPAERDDGREAVRDANRAAWLADRSREAPSRAEIAPRAAEPAARADGERPFARQGWWARRRQELGEARREGDGTARTGTPRGEGRRRGLFRRHRL